MHVEKLKTELNKVNLITNQQWLNSLNQRKKEELAFHDRHRDQSRRQELATQDQDTYEKFYGNKKYYATTELSKEYVKEWVVKNAKDKVFLDYACGNGKEAIRAAKAGAKLAIGLDISEVSVENAKRAAEASDVAGNTCFIQADAENTMLPPNSVDVVICSGMLHHLDLSYAFPELRRILAPGGKILAVEALDYNPAIKLYRMLTPQMRTKWEKSHILSLKDLKFASRFFKIGEIRYWHILSILGPFMKPLLPLFNKLDGLMTRIPALRLLAWIFTFELIKPKEV